MRILITGSKGQLGSELKALAIDYPEYQFFHTDIEELNITDKKAIVNFVDKNNITSIINCAAYTAVDAAEENEKTAESINHKAVEHLAEISKANQIKLVHISTDYVFDGQHYKPYRETDTPNPQGVYGKTKLMGEKAILDIKPANTIIIRTSWVYSSYGKNFVKTMLKLADSQDQIRVIADQVGSPTYARDLAEAILEIVPQLDNNSPELYHFANQGVCSWYDFAKAIFELKNIDIPVKAIETKDYLTLAKKPFYSVLNSTKIKTKYSIEIPHWRESLENMINL